MDKTQLSIFYEKYIKCKVFAYDYKRRMKKYISHALVDFINIFSDYKNNPNHCISKKRYLVITFILLCYEEMLFRTYEFIIDHLFSSYTHHILTAKTYFDQNIVIQKEIEDDGGSMLFFDKYDEASNDPGVVYHDFFITCNFLSFEYMINPIMKWVDFNNLFSPHHFPLKGIHCYDCKKFINPEKLNHACSQKIFGKTIRGFLFHPTGLKQQGIVATVKDDKFLYYKFYYRSDLRRKSKPYELIFNVQPFRLYNTFIFQIPKIGACSDVINYIIEFIGVTSLVNQFLNLKSDNTPSLQDLAQHSDYTSIHTLQIYNEFENLFPNFTFL